MAALSIRGLDTEQLAQLKSEASRLGLSLNWLILQRLTGDSPQHGRPHGDLDALAGSWSAEEAEAFTASIALDTNTFVGFKRGDADCIEVVRRAGLRLRRARTPEPRGTQPRYGLPAGREPNGVH